MSLAGCFAGGSGRPGDGRADIDMPVSTASLALDVSGLRNAFRVPEQNGITEVPVEGWRSTLRSGYQNGPGRFFAASNSPDYTLRFSKAELEYTPIAVYERTGGQRRSRRGSSTWRR